jgi:mannose-1-phosphate guanylyltransferase/mannose-6-phosphate isomerase
MRVVLPFILYGGAGTRLWPLSREAFPKQFHSIGTSKTLFQESCLRLRGAPFGTTTILAKRKHRFLIADQLDEVGIESGALVLEREARNTAPTACIAALMAIRLDPDALMLLAPSDHLIDDADAFKASIVGGIEAAEAGKLVLFGVNHAHTGYGYILTEDGDGAARKVTGFAEKPPREIAQRYLDSGNADWNAGLFSFNLRRCSNCSRLMRRPLSMLAVWRWMKRSRISALSSSVRVMGTRPQSRWTMRSSRRLTISLA